MDEINTLKSIVGDAHVFVGETGGRYGADWTGSYVSTPLAAVRPANRDEVSAVVKYASEQGISVVPMSGNTSLAGGTYAEGSIVISLERMNAVREVRASSRLAVVEAGVIMSDLHQAADQHDLLFPMTFGARGSAMIGGMLSTNAGGSNVLRYGNTRDLCLGLEVVMPDGEIMEIMSELHKDNSGYNLKHLIIGAEGTLGIITAAVMKLVAKPKARATAMIATQSLDTALTLLNELQQSTGGSVDAFEFMPRRYMSRYKELFPEKRLPFEAMHETNILIELATTASDLSDVQEDGKTLLGEKLENILAQEFEKGSVHEAVVAQNEAQRQEMWHIREAAAEVTLAHTPLVSNDVAVPLDQVSTFFEKMEPRLAEIDEGAISMSVAHLGDGNIHYSVWPQSQDPEVHAEIMESVENVVLSLGGSFSAEHGIGITKLPSMQRRKNEVAMRVMREIKQAIDPKNIMNPGKVVPATA